jgi:hypothetical protein
MHRATGFEEFPALIAEALSRAVRTPAVLSSVAGRFPLDRVADAYRALESDAGGRSLSFRM